MHFKADTQVLFADKQLKVVGFSEYLFLFCVRLSFIETRDRFSAIISIPTSMYFVKIITPNFKCQNHAFMKDMRQNVLLLLANRDKAKARHVTLHTIQPTVHPLGDQHEGSQ